MGSALGWTEEVVAEQGFRDVLMVLRHWKTSRLLSAYSDRELGAGARGLVVRHLAECKRCRLDLAVIQRLGNSLTRLRNNTRPETTAAVVRLRSYGDSFWLMN